jgi:nucleotide-binding universal stress UspA family protein
MTIKTILAYLPTQTAAPAVLTAARIIAELRGGFVTGIHLTQGFPAFGEFATEIYEVRQKQSEAAQSEAAAIKELFDERAQKTTVPHEWRNHTVPYKLGVELMVDAARTADLVIFSKPEAAHAYWGGDLADIVLIQSGRLLLIVPPSFQEGRIGDRVVIAWNNTREAARAVFDSLDLIRDASSVRVITHIRDETERSAAEASNSAVVTALRCHVAQVSGEVVQADGSGMSEESLARMADRQCDLLVMDGYGHSRFSEMIFGGVSREILRQTTVPALLSH